MSKVLNSGRVSKGEANFGFFNARNGKVRDDLPENFRRWKPPLTFETFEEGLEIMKGAVRVWGVGEVREVRGEREAVWNHVNQEQWGGEQVVLRRLTAAEAAWSRKFEDDMIRNEETFVGQVVSGGKVLNLFVEGEEGERDLT